MSQTTPLLGLPYLDAAQAQKHVIHNEALRMLDAVVQLAVADRNLAAPPAEPVNGDRYIVAAGASGVWAGRAGQVAAWQDDAWAFFAPMPGWLAWVADEGLLVAWDGGGWVIAGGDGGGGSGGSGGSGGESSPLLGVNATADATNRLAVKSDAVLLSHDDVTPGTGDMRAVMNKAGESNTASLLFQAGSSGRAEIGLAGDDKLHVKMSADGSAWTEAMVVGSGGDWIGFGGYVAPFVGAAPPGVLKAVAVGSSNYTELHVASHDNSGNAAQIGYRSRGSMASPTAVADADWLFSFFARGYDGAAYRNSAGIRIAVNGTPASNSVPGKISFQTVSVGGSALTPRLEITAAGHALPGTDNAYTLGASGSRWASVWAATGTIQTSDARDKDVVGSLGFSGELVDAVDPVLFRWKVGGNEVRESETEFETGPGGEQVPVLETVPRPGTRAHAGFLAQDIKAAMDVSGVDFGAWGLEDKDDSGSRQFMRPDQLVAVLWAALKETRVQLSDIRNELDDLRSLTMQ